MFDIEINFSKEIKLSLAKMKFESFSDWKKKLIEYGNREDTVVIVEGKRDEDVLKRWGVKNVFPIKGRRFYDILEEVEYCELCILLIDVDKQGEKIFTRLRDMLKREGIPVDTAFREYMKGFDIKEVEELPLVENGGV